MRSLLILVAMGSVAHADRVVVLTERPDLPDALKAVVGTDVEVVAEPMTAPPGDLAFDRAASAQHLALTDGASAAVWIDNAEVWMVTADGRIARHAPLADVSNPHVFAAIAAHLLDELAPPSTPAPAPVAIEPPPVVDQSPLVVETVAPPPAVPAVHRSPRLALAVGGLIGQRGMSFQQSPPDAPMTPPSYPASSVNAVALKASAFPYPEERYGDELTGFGGTLEVQKSINAEVDANDLVNDTYGAYGLDYTSLEIGAHYRHKMGALLLDGMVSYNSASWTLAGDFPTSVAIPDTRYQHVDVGGSLEVAVSERARVGVGARYMYILSTGDVSNPDWYGSASSSGLGVDVDFKIPLTDTVFLRGLLEYRRVSMELDGDGTLSASNMLAVSNIVDTWFLGGVQLGVAI